MAECLSSIHLFVSLLPGGQCIYIPLKVLIIAIILLIASLCYWFLAFFAFSKPPGSKPVNQCVDDKQAGIGYWKYTAYDFALFIIFNYLRIVLF